MSLQTKERLGLARPLFTSEIALAVTDPQTTSDEVFPEEMACLSPRAVDKRKREFTAGRLAAHQALSQLGHDPAPILVGPKRAPIWPAGMTGSISHTRDCAMAVAAHRQDITALGIDVEEDTPLSPDLLPAICSPREQDWLKGQEQPGQLAKLIFSAKEAAYKCQYTVSERYFGFDGMEVEIDLAQRSFTARFTAAQPPFEAGRLLEGRFAIGAGVIITATVLRDSA